MTDAQKRWIDEASYTDLLRRWRFATAGDEMFQGEAGEYYSATMARKRQDANHVASSKEVGWEKP